MFESYNRQMLLACTLCAGIVAYAMNFIVPMVPNISALIGFITSMIWLHSHENVYKNFKSDVDRILHSDSNIRRLILICMICGLIITTLLASIFHPTIAACSGVFSVFFISKKLFQGS